MIVASLRLRTSAVRQFSPYFKVGVESPPFILTEPSRDIDANDPIEKGGAEPRPGERTTHVAPAFARARPADVAEHHGPDQRMSLRQLHPAEPEGIAGHGAGSVSAHRVRAA